MNDRKSPGLVLRCAEGVIRAACGTLSEAERGERELEWSIEAEDVACDPDIRFRLVRAARTLWFALSLLLHVRATSSTSAGAAWRTASRSFIIFAITTASTVRKAVTAVAVGAIAFGVANSPGAAVAVAIGVSFVAFVVFVVTKVRREGTEEK